jgi:hypothetical protein
LGVRKDVLSGNSQQDKEAEFNRRIAQASKDATSSIRQLADAKSDLADTQERLAKAAADANNAVRQLSLAQIKISELSAKSEKIETLSIRIQLTLSTLRVPSIYSCVRRTTHPNLESLLI